MGHYGGRCTTAAAIVHCVLLIDVCFVLKTQDEIFFGVMLW